jgi:hypothetical protein
MREYYKNNPARFKRTPEQQAEHNRRRREKYKADKEYREKAKRAVADYWASNPEKRFATRIKKYGIVPSDFYAMLERQNGGCAICGKEHSGCAKQERLHIDHCHSTGRVRGLLCTNCNLAIGKLRDSPRLLRKAAEYIEDSDK